MLTAEQILSDLERWDVELELVATEASPYCLRLRFPDSMPPGLRRLICRAVARRRFVIASLVARGVGQDARMGRAETGEGRPETGADS